MSLIDVFERALDYFNPVSEWKEGEMARVQLAPSVLSLETEDGKTMVVGTAMEENRAALVDVRTGDFVTLNGDGTVRPAKKGDVPLGKLM